MRLTLVARGAWASKFSTGSIFPLVETMARIGPRTAVVVCTRSAPRCEKIGMRTMAAAALMMIQFQRRRVVDPCELLLPDAKFVFQGETRITVSNNLPPWEAWEKSNAACGVHG